MTGFTINYKIEDSSIKPESVREWYQLNGGIRVIFNDIILTKNVQAPDDEGFIGNYILYEIPEIIEAIPRLIEGQKCMISIEEDMIGISLDLTDGQVYFSIVSTQHECRWAIDTTESYPCGERGCPIPAKIFFAGVIDLGEKFIADVSQRYVNLHNYVKDIKTTLDYASKVAEDYDKP
ncbi:hypothetical protein [Methanocella sp. MCL-LM]|uniref:hypothetical protein n=1 Tax=Methanocella sp. MCL-LM TaxID=3412035 RepID=UPI003C72AD0F